MREALVSSTFIISEASEGYLMCLTIYSKQFLYIGIVAGNVVL